MSELKSCPFCGGNAVMTTKHLSEVYAYADKVSISCKNCGVSRSAIGDMSGGGYADNSKCESIAINRWNTRTDDTLTERVKELEKLADALLWKCIESDSDVADSDAWHELERKIKGPINKCEKE